MGKHKEDWREQEMRIHYRRIVIETVEAAMRGVRADPPEGAVLELVKAVRAVEWVTRENGTKHHFCPRCGNWEHHGHATDCELDAALSRFGVGGGEIEERPSDEEIHQAQMDAAELDDAERRATKG